MNVTVPANQPLRQEQDWCSLCSAPLDPRSATLSEHGPICPQCEMAQSWREAEIASTTASTGGALGLGPVGWGVISLFFNFMMIPSILAIVAGVQDLKATSAARTAGVGFDAAARPIRRNAVIGIVLGCIHPALMVLIIGAVFVAALFSPGYDDPLYDDDLYYQGLGAPSAWEDPYDPEPLDLGYPDPLAPSAPGWQRPGDPLAPAAPGWGHPSDPLAPAGVPSGAASPPRVDDY